MSTRLQIIVEDDDADRWRACATDEGVNLSEWMRRAARELERAGRRRRSPEAKLEALARLAGTVQPPVMPPLEEYADYAAWYAGTRFGNLPEP